eukprot:6488926-Amphidinium_carterae.1
MLPPAGICHTLSPDSPSVQEAISTWTPPITLGAKKPSCNQRIQIDFIITNHNATHATSSCTPLPWNSFATVHPSDHRPIVITLTITMNPPQTSRTRRFHRRFTDDTHRAKFTKSFTTLHKRYYNDARSRLHTPMEQCTCLQHLAFHAMQKAAPRNSLVPKKCWISAQTLALLTDLSKARQLSALYYRSTHRSLSVILQDTPLHGIPSDLQRDIVSIDELKVYITIAVKRARKALRADKGSWVDDVCKQVDLHADGHHAERVYRQVRRLVSTPKKPPHIRLTNQMGNVTCDADAIDDIWTEHWCAHFAASRQLSQPYIMRHDPNPRVPCLADADSVSASASQIEHILSHLQKHKAVPNLLPTEAWKLCAAHFAPAITNLINDTISTSLLPTPLMGSIVIPVPKKGKTPTMPSSFRPIQLQPLERKVFGRWLHREVLQHLSLPKCQFAVGDAAGVQTPIFIAGQLLACLLDKRVSASVTFLDLSAAYDTVLHHVLFPQTDGSDMFDSMMDALATSHCEARHVGDYIRCHPCVLAGSDMPTPLFNVLRQWIEAWMMTPQAWARARVATSPTGCPSRWCYEMVHRFRPQASAEPAQPTLHMDRGVKQGDSLSTVLFTLYLDKALQLANSRFDTIADLNNWDVRPQLHSPVGRCYFDASQFLTCDAAPVRLSHLAYADDITIPLSHPSPRVLVNATAKMIETVQVAMTEFGLAINFDPHKTGLCLRLVGGEGRGVWQFIKNSSSALSSSCSSRATKSATLPFVISPSLTVHITDSYKYLGKITSPTLAHDAEIKARKTATVAAFQENRRVLTSSHTQLRHKIQLYKTLCMPHLLQQLHTSPKLPEKAFQQLEHLYISHLKYIARLNFTSPMRWRDVRDCDVLQLLGEPPLRHHLMCRRLMHMRKLIVHSDVHIQAALNVTSRSSIWHRWLEDLTLLQVLTPGLRLLPTPSLSTLSDWLAFIVPADVVWPRILKQHTTPINTAVRSQPSLTIDPVTDPYLVEIAGLPAPDEHEIHHDVAPLQPRATTESDGPHFQRRPPLPHLLSLLLHHPGVAHA